MQFFFTEKPSSAKAPQKPSDVERQKTAPSGMAIRQPQVVTGSTKEGRLKVLLRKVEHDVSAGFQIIFLL